SNTDYATIEIVAAAAGSGSISVTDALFTWPAGTYAGFVIQDVIGAIQADLFETIIISTWNNGEFVEARSGTELLDLSLLILFISPAEGVYNVGFKTTAPFDEIRIT